jgi:HK97 family phage prohead protease
MTAAVISERSLPAGSVGVRSSPGAAAAPGTMFGTLAVFDRWDAVDSPAEGQFMERLAPGSFTKTLREQRSRIQVVYDHGMDAVLGRKPLGVIKDLHADARGVHYEVALHDASYVRELLPALRAGQLGSSFRFKPITGKVHVVRHPTRSLHNPDGWEERTVLELRMIEFGPTAFPIYDGTSAGVRSFAGSPALSVDAFVAILTAPPDRAPDAAVRAWGDRVAPLPARRGGR